MADVQRVEVAFCRECPVELVLDAMEIGGELRRADFCAWCWRTVTTALRQPVGAVVLRFG